MIPGVDHSVDFPSTYNVEDLDLSHTPTITADNESAYHHADEDLDVKLPATMKAQDVLLEDLVPTSIPLPHKATNRIGVREQLNVSKDLNNIHVFNDNNEMTMSENIPRQWRYKLNQQKDPAIKSELVSKTTTKIVNLDHTMKFQECMDSYEIWNGVHSFDMIALAIAFYECTCNIHLVLTKSSAHKYLQYSCNQHL